MYKQITIKTLKQQGSNNTEIARQIGCHRNTVIHVLSRENFIEIQTRKKGSLFDPYQQQIKQLRDKKISILRIFEILRDTYGTHSTYVNLCKYIESRFPKQKEAFGVQITEPGEVAEIDFGYLGMFPGPLDKPVKTYGLAVILPYSKLDFYAITYDQKLETLVSELMHAFAYFSGVPAKLKVDNMKTAILKNQHYDLEFNPDFLEFAYHYNTVIIPCTPYSPQQKGTVESGIKYLQGNFISGRTFTAPLDMKAQLRDWMDNYANKRIHGTTGKVPAEMFREEEAEKLQPLPDTPFAFFNRCTRTVAMNCHIHLDNNYYSVPANLVGKDVVVRFNDKLVRIIYAGEQVTLHQKAAGVGNYVTKRSHMPEYKVYSETEYQRKAEEQMADIGEETHEYFRYLLSCKESYWFRSVRVILGLAKEYGTGPVNLALKRALYYKVTDLNMIRNILEKKLYLVSEEPRLVERQGHLADYPAEQTSLLRDLSYYTISERSNT